MLSLVDMRYRLRSNFGLLRGKLCRSSGRATDIRHADGPLLLGPNLEWIRYPDSKIVLAKETPGSIPLDAQSQPLNPYCPRASSVGFYPYWKYLDPPVNRPTRLRLQDNATLSLEPNTLICVGTYVSIWPHQTLHMGTGSYIGHESYINTRSGLLIGQHTLIGHRVTIMDYDGHPVYYDNRPDLQETYGGHTAPIRIGSNVWIGFGSTILKGVTIGDGAIIGANSCVTRDVPPRAMVAGNPAKVIQEGITWKKF